MISFSVVIIAVAISFLLAFFWLAIINYKTGFVKWIHSNIFSLAVGSIAAVGLAGVLEFILLEDKYLFGFNSADSAYSLGSSLFFYILFAAILEELFKGIVTWWGIKKINLEIPRDGAVVGMIVGLFFAVAENGIYFANQINSSELVGVLSLVLSRTIISSIAHMVFSGILGFFIAKGVFTKKIIGKFIWGISGFMVAVLVHTLFNFFVITGFPYVLLMVAVIIGVVMTMFVFKE